MLLDTRSTTTADTHARSSTRVLLLFSLNGRVPPRPLDQGGQRLLDRFDFGRFAAHLVNSDVVLPTIVHAERLSPDEFGLPPGLDSRVPLGSVALLLLTTPREDATLVVDCGLDGEDVPADELAAWLAATCFRRDELTLGGQPILTAIASRLSEPPAQPLHFGHNVHQIVLPGGQFRAGLLAAGPGGERRLSAIIYRGQMSPDADGPLLGISMPPPMNSPGVTLAAHGRGVTVLAGWSVPVENGLTLVAVALLSAMAVLQRSRLAAFAMMRANERATLNSPSEARELITMLSGGVNQLELDLAFGVEAYVDSLLVPELLAASFQNSLRDALAIPDALANSSRMIARLTSVINARSAALDSAVAERDERRERTFSALLAVGTLLALPPALLLAYFGVNGTDVDPRRSILDIGHYWRAYVVAWAPFLTLALVAYVLRRRAGRIAAPVLPPPPPRIPVPLPAPVPGPRPPTAGS